MTEFHSTDVPAKGRSRADGEDDFEELQPGPWPQLFVGLLLIGLLGSVALRAVGFQSERRLPWTEMVLPLLGALAAYGLLLRRLPGQNALTVTAVILLFSGAIVLCGTISGIPFGAIRFTDLARPKLFGRLPVWMPLWWLVILVSSRDTARLIMHRWRRSRFYGLWVLALGGALATVVDLGMEPVGVTIMQLWEWQTSEGTACWYSAPWVNSLGWFVTTVVTLGFCMPWFITKRPTRPPMPFLPALTWGALNFYFVATNALAGLWPPVAVVSPIAAVVLLLAWHGMNTPMRPRSSVTAQLSGA